MTDQLDTNDMVHHEFACAQLQQAQTIVNAWMVLLTQKYRLGEKDRVNAQGQIERHPA